MYNYVHVYCWVFFDSRSPDVSYTHVMFKGENTEELQRELADILMDNARIVMVDGRPRKMLGTLLITPEYGTGNIIVIPLNPPITPTATTPLPTSVTWIGKN